MNHSTLLPFYMTYPMPLFYEQEDSVMKDLEYMQQMYPVKAKEYQKKIASLLDLLDYEGSMIYDEYPDRWQLLRLCGRVTDELKKEEEKDGNTVGKEKEEWMADMVQVLLYYEIYKRRHENNRGILRF